MRNTREQGLFCHVDSSPLADPRGLCDHFQFSSLWGSNPSLLGVPAVEGNQHGDMTSAFSMSAKWGEINLASGALPSRVVPIVETNQHRSRTPALSGSHYWRESNMAT